MRIRANRIAFQTIVVKEVLRFSRIWVQTILPPAVVTTLYFVIFGTLIGERIGLIDGLAYIDFIVPGLILMAVITHAYANVVSSFFGAKFQRHIEELLVAPVPSVLIVAGFVAGGVLRGLTVGVVVTLVSLMFSDFGVFNLMISVSVVLLTSVIFATAGFINGLFAKTFDDVAIMPTFVLTPLTYLGGVFYSVSMLPEFWEKASYLNPLLYMISGFRYGLLGVSDIDIRVALVILVGMSAGLFGFAVLALQRGYGIRD